MEELSSCTQNIVTKNDREWFTNIHGSDENNKKLELTLAPPGLQKWSISTSSTTTFKHNCDSLLSLGQHHHHHHDHDHETSWFVEKESSLHQCSNIRTKMAELQHIRSNDDSVNATVPQKRTASGRVIGWPPLRSFRKNLASSNGTKPSPDQTESQKIDKHEKKTTEATTTIPVKGLFVKINMDGIPIGRKLDLNAYNSYENLASAVDKLFRGLLAAQTDFLANGSSSNVEVGKHITGLLDGSGEYTLVYEDNEGDRVLVGDVPWRMFVSNVKRLRVLKTSELPSLSIGGKEQKMEQPR